MPDMHGLNMEDHDMGVDVIKCLGNPSDIVEIRADLVVDVVRMISFESRAQDLRTRIEWWLDEGGDEYVSLSLFHSTCPSIQPPFFDLTQLYTNYVLQCLCHESL